MKKPTVKKAKRAVTKKPSAAQLAARAKFAAAAKARAKKRAKNPASDRIGVSKRMALKMFWEAGFDTDAKMMLAARALDVLKPASAGYYYADDVSRAIAAATKKPPRQSNPSAAPRHAFYLGLRKGKYGSAPFVGWWTGTHFDTNKRLRLAFAGYDAAVAEYKKQAKLVRLAADEFFDVDIVQLKGK